MEPQKHHKGMRHHIPRGKGLRGSSAINYMIGENIKQCMRKHQTLEPIDDSVTDRSTMPFVGENHGTSSPVWTSFNHWRLPIEDDVTKACDKVTGFNKKSDDPWSGDHIGFFNNLGTVARTGPNKGERSYAARCYFEANVQRTNLHVLCEALVTNVDLNGDKAVGVNFTHEGCIHNVKAASEVIVSCGALQTPQILELSGIGDPDVLHAAGVECKVVNRGVGANFQDHSLTEVVWERIDCGNSLYKPGNPTLDAIHDPQVMQAAQQQYMESQTGPMSSISSMQGFFPYKITKSVENFMVNLTPFQQKQYERTLEQLKSNKSANLQLVLVGATPDLVNGPEDQSRTLLCWGAGIQMLAKADQTIHLKDKIQTHVAPDPNVDMTNMENARQWVRDWVVSEYHPCGSCAMGDALDSRLRVKGVQGLRVVDASIFPNHVSENIISSV
ncbi:MAG: hypothetical protein FE78DRAFT_74393 [Acidomyces sp. 'richmondensis']|nr:MAG: hypothetical protein FE78DRAFT_74393 [Acidomyces sp. 'richmondensis']